MISRRKFVQAAGLSGPFIVCCRSAATTFLNQAEGRSFEHGSPLREFHYGQVSYSAGLHQSQLNKNRDVLMSLSEDSLLKPFRLRAGMPAPGCDLHGWYSSEELGGETFGQWISALSRYYAISGDDALRAKVIGLLDAFAQTIEPTGRIFGDPKFTGGPAYHYDKLTCGLMDAHEFVRYPKALDILDSVTKAVRRNSP